MEVRIFLAAATLVAAAAAWFDFRTGHIPNRLTLGVLGVSPVAHAIVGLVHHEGPRDVLMRVGSSLLGILCALIPLLLFRSGTLGGGDVKILAAIGALCGFEIGMNVVLHSFVFGGVMAVAVFAYKGKLIRMMQGVGTTVTNLFRPKDKRKVVTREAMTWFRLGPAIFVATAVEVAMRWSERVS